MKELYYRITNKGNYSVFLTKRNGDNDYLITGSKLYVSEKELLDFLATCENEGIFTKKKLLKKMEEVNFNNYGKDDENSLDFEDEFQEDNIEEEVKTIDYNACLKENIDITLSEEFLKQSLIEESFLNKDEELFSKFSREDLLQIAFEGGCQENSSGNRLFSQKVKNESKKEKEKRIELMKKDKEIYENYLKGMIIYAIGNLRKGGDNKCSFINSITEKLFVDTLKNDTEINDLQRERFSYINYFKDFKSNGFNFNLSKKSIKELCKTKFSFIFQELEEIYGKHEDEYENRIKEFEKGNNFEALDNWKEYLEYYGGLSHSKYENKKEKLKNMYRYEILEKEGFVYLFSIQEIKDDKKAINLIMKHEGILKERIKKGFWIEYSTLGFLTKLAEKGDDEIKFLLKENTIKGSINEEGLEEFYKACGYGFE